MRWFLFVWFSLGTCTGAEVVDWSLYLVAQRGDHTLEWLLDTIEEAVRGGVTVVQLDEPNLDTETFVALASACMARVDVPVIINNRIDVAKESFADGVHLLHGSQEAVAAARAALGPGAIIGFSARQDEAQIADGFGADYLSIGVIFPSKSHPDKKPWGTEGIARARSLTPLPLLAVGGIRPHNVREARDAGADGVVVVAAIMSAPDPKKAAEELVLK